MYSLVECTDATLNSIPTENYYVVFEVFTTVTTKSTVFWLVTPCSCITQRQKTEYTTVQDIQVILTSQFRLKHAEALQISRVRFIQFKLLIIL